MTTYMTILWITIHSGPMAGETFGIPYALNETCQAAMKPVGDTLDYDYSMNCEKLPLEVTE
jgi:hypothetical protein